MPTCTLAKNKMLKLADAANAIPTYSVVPQMPETASGAAAAARAPLNLLDHVCNA